MLIENVNVHFHTSFDSVSLEGELLMGNSDSILYHYTKFDTAIDYILKEKKLRFSNLRGANDPYEKYNFVFSGSYSCVDKPEKNKMNFLTTSFWISNALKEGVQTICFAEDIKTENIVGQQLYNIGRGFAKPRMWAQYAENFMGICLLFNKDKLLRIVDEELQSVEISHAKIHYYREEEFIWKVSHATNINESEMQLTNEVLLDKKINDNRQLFFFSKHIDWKDENEYRLLIRNFSDEYVYVNIDGTLEKIIVGMDTDETKVELVKKCVEKFIYEPMIQRIEFWDGYYALTDL